MTWTATEWEAFCHLVEEAWPGEFDDQARASWRVLLDGVPTDAATEALKRLLYSGRKFYPRPAVSDLLAELRADPSLPTFDEAWVLIERTLSRTPEPDGRFKSEGEARKAHDRAILDALDAHHPMIRSFVERQGLARLRTIQTGDPQWGEKHLADLRAAWERHVEASDRRQVAALASGDREGLRQLDPLAAIGMASALDLLDRMLPEAPEVVCAAPEARAA